jgi:hypothetical protein
VARALDDVWPENLDAWRIFQRLASRLVIEAQLGPEVFRRLTEDLDVSAVEDTLERVGVIYDIVLPQKKSE